MAMILKKLLLPEKIIVFLTFIVLFTILSGSFLVNKASRLAEDLITHQVRPIISFGNIYINEFNKFDWFNTSQNQTDRYMSDIIDFCNDLEKEDYVYHVDYTLKKNMLFGNNAQAELDPSLMEKLNIAIEDIIDNNFDNAVRNKEYDQQLLSDILFNTNYDVRLLGENSSDTIALRYKNSRVTEGRSFTDEEISEGRFVCMVPKGYTIYSSDTDSKIKEAEIGDTLYCRSAFFKEGQYAGGKTYEFEIIGIIQNENSEDDSQFRVVVPNQCILKIRNDDLYFSNLYGCEIMGTEWADTAPSQYDFSNYDMMLYYTLTEEKIIEMSRVRIELNYPRDIEKFNDYYHSHLSEYPTLKVSISTADFDRIAGPVRNLRNLSQIVLIIVTLVSLLVTGLLVLLSIKNRFREMGLYLALGERKYRIVLGLVTEYMIIGFLALIISMFFGNIIAEKGTEAVISQYDFPAEQIESEFTTATTEDVINAFDVKLDTDSALMLTACTMVIVLTASTLASLYIVRIKPREVLLK